MRLTAVLVDLNRRWLTSDRDLTVDQWGSVRILAIVLLLSGSHLPRLQIPLSLPSEMVDTSRRPFADLILSAPDAVVKVASVLLVALAIAVLTGTSSRIAGLALAAGILLGSSALYSTVGKIVHFQWIAVALGIMSLASWGDDVHRWSVSPRLVLAWIMACGLATSAGFKVLGNWLNPTFSAVEFQLVRFVVTADGGGPLNGRVRDLSSAAAFEFFDLATVAVELSLLLLVWRPDWFRGGLLALMGFHVSIWLTLGISFAPILPAYVIFFADWMPASASTLRLAYGRYLLIPVVALGTLSGAAVWLGKVDLPVWLGTSLGYTPWLFSGVVLLAVPSLLLVLRLARHPAGDDAASA